MKEQIEYLKDEFKEKNNIISNFNGSCQSLPICLQDYSSPCLVVVKSRQNIDFTLDTFLKCFGLNKSSQNHGSTQASEKNTKLDKQFKFSLNYVYSEN